MAHVTVVLPTHRRPDSLRRVTAGLARQEDPGVPWDVVIVENDDTSTASAAVLAASEQLPVASSVVLERVLGASSARNRGIAEASGSIVAFIDDDVVPDDDWLMRLVEPVLAGRCDAVGGQVALDQTVPVPGWIPRWLRPYLAEFQPAAGEIDLRDLAEGVLVEPYVLTANAAFTADVLARAGGFDPLLGPRRGVPMVNDDVGLSRKVLALGASMRYVPDAREVHELPPSRLRRLYLAKRLYAQGRSDWLLDRGPLAATRTAGAHTATVAFAKEVVRDVRAGTMPRPQHTFLWCQAARRAGFLRESLAELARRRQRRSRGPS
jgi:GT2 family glycosyltransferase